MSSNEITQFDINKHQNNNEPFKSIQTQIPNQLSFFLSFLVFRNPLSLQRHQTAYYLSRPERSRRRHAHRKICRTELQNDLEFTFSWFPSVFNASNLLFRGGTSPKSHFSYYFFLSVMQKWIVLLKFRRFTLENHEKVERSTMNYSP